MGHARTDAAPSRADVWRRAGAAAARARRRCAAVPSDRAQAPRGAARGGPARAAAGVDVSDRRRAGAERCGRGDPPAGRAHTRRPAPPAPPHARVRSARDAGRRRRGRRARPPAAAGLPLGSRARRCDTLPGRPGSARRAESAPGPLARRLGCRPAGRDRGGAASPPGTRGPGAGPGGRGRGACRTRGRQPVVAPGRGRDGGHLRDRAPAAARRTGGTGRARPRGALRHAAPVPGPRTVVAVRDGRPRPRRLSSRRHGPRENRAGPRVPAAPPRRNTRRPAAFARRLPDVGGRQLGAGDRPLRALPPRRLPLRLLAPQDGGDVCRHPARRGRANHLRALAPGCASPRRGRLGHGDPRRGAAYSRTPPRVRRARRGRCAPPTGSRSPARRSKTVWPNCGRSWNTPRPGSSARSTLSCAGTGCRSSATATRRRPSGSGGWSARSCSAG
jgi:hypothetical protein